MSYVKRLSAFFYNNINSKIYFLFAFLYMVFGFIIMPYAIKLISETETIFDLRFGYTLLTAKKLLETIGASGRSNYLIYSSLIDPLYGIVYCIFFIYIISSLYNKTFSPNYEFRFFNLVPLVILMADIGENSLVIVNLLSYPFLSENAVAIGSNFTLIKWGGILFNILVVLLGVFAFVIKKARKI